MNPRRLPFTFLTIVAFGVAFGMGSGCGGPGASEDAVAVARPLAPEPEEPVTRTASAASETENQDDCEAEHPWQHKVDGSCVDKPDTVHHSGDYEPSPGEQCWVECLCYEEQRPSSESCSPCSYVGTVCTPL